MAPRPNAQGRVKRLNPARRTPRTNLRSVYKGGKKAVGGGTRSKLPSGPNPRGKQARRVKNASKKR